MNQGGKKRKQTFMATMSLVTGQVVMILRHHPVVLMPFLAIAACDMLLLFVLYAAPASPFSGVFPPLLRLFDAEGLLRSPSHLLLLAQTYGYVRNAVSFITGILFTGVAVAMVHQAMQAVQPAWTFGFRKTLRRYARLMVLWALSLAIGLATPDIFSYSTYLLAGTKASILVGFILTVGAQMLFVFALPAVIIENKKLWPALRRSLNLFYSRFWETLAILALPNAIILFMLPSLTPVSSLSEQPSPHILLLMLGMRIMLLMVLNIWIVTSITVLLALHRQGERAVTLPV